MFLQVVRHIPDQIRSTATHLPDSKVRVTRLGPSQRTQGLGEGPPPTQNTTATCRSQKEHRNIAKSKLDSWPTYDRGKSQPPPVNVIPHHVPWAHVDAPSDPDGSRNPRVINAKRSTTHSVHHWEPPRHGTMSPDRTQCPRQAPMDRSSERRLPQPASEGRPTYANQCNPLSSSNRHMATPHPIRMG